ncbi:MAG: ATP synthase F0 subunit B [Nitrospirota bacterium]
MLEFEPTWFFVQLATFLSLIFILNTMLFKPMLRLFKEREEGTKGSLGSAKAMDSEKDEVLAKIEEKLSEARRNARTAFEGLSNEGLDEQKKALDSAQNEAVEINRKAKEELNAAADKARAGLKSDIESFSKQIVEKLVGAK